MRAAGVDGLSFGGPSASGPTFFEGPSGDGGALIRLPANKDRRMGKLPLSLDNVTTYSIEGDIFFLYFTEAKLF